MSISAIPHAQQILGILKEAGVKYIVISPGSRNAPLTLSFAQDDDFECYSIVDERSASHFGLGMAQQLRLPVVLLCTSGSALLNYFPAVAEAYYSEIPLIVISADRPPYKIDIGDGQTIQQKAVYGGHVLAFVDLKIPDQQPDYLATNHDLLEKALAKCLQQRGPIHINVPFEEPLYDEVDRLNLSLEHYRFQLAQADDVAEMPSALRQQWSEAPKVMVLVGGLHPGEVEPEAMQQLARSSNVLMLTEVGSNLVSEHVINGIDLLLAPMEHDQEALEAFRPDLLLTLGGMIVSKKIKQFLRKYAPRQHWHIGKSRALDTYGVLTGHFSGSVEDFLKQAGDRQQLDDYSKHWKHQFSQRVKNRETYVKNSVWSDLQAFTSIFSHLPDQIHLQLGNSSTIRYAQLFSMRPDWEIFCNRGTSGIDGSTSTAVGAAAKNQLPSVLVCGDLSFFYDVNGLWNNYVPRNMVFIVINNGGGGIFRILPGDKDKAYFKRFFETRHDLDASSLATRFDFGYLSANDLSELTEALEEVFHSDNQRERPVILEISTPSGTNDRILLDLFKNIR